MNGIIHLLKFADIRKYYPLLWIRVAIGYGSAIMDFVCEQAYFFIEMNMIFFKAQ